MGRPRYTPSPPPAWLVVGAKVDYCSIVGRAPTQLGMIVRAGPELAASNDWVVWLEGKSGSVWAEACLAPGSYKAAGCGCGNPGGRCLMLHVVTA